MRVTWSLLLSHTDNLLTHPYDIWAVTVSYGRLVVTFLIFLAICGVVLVKLPHLSLGNREDIFITHLIIISEVSVFPTVVIFIRGCVHGWLYYHMLSVSYIFRESLFCFLSLLCGLMICAYNRVHYGPMVVFVCLHFTLSHYHHYADVSGVPNF